MLVRKADTPDLWARHDIKQQDSARFWLRDAKCLVFDEEFGLMPWFKDRVVQEQPVGVWTRTEVLFQPPCPAHSLLFPLQYILTALTYHLKKVPKISLLSFEKQLSSYKILPEDGGSMFAFWGEP